MYKAQESTGSGAPLDHNHTHFILVDDGTEGKYGGEIEFRTDLERYISDNCILENSACGKFDESKTIIHHHCVSPLFPVNAALMCIHVYVYYVIKAWSLT